MVVGVFDLIGLILGLFEMNVIVFKVVCCVVDFWLIVMSDEIWFYLNLCFFVSRRDFNMCWVMGL